jgi:acetolactate synthase-1/2/3 large subunit
LAAPDRFVVLTVGDGSYLYNPVVQALAASRQMGLPVLVVVFNNRQYLSMKMNHLRFYPDGQSVEHRMFQGVDLADQPDIAAVARACGVHGISVADRDALPAALAEAVAAVVAGMTCVVDVRVTR